MSEIRISTISDIDGWGFTYESIESQISSGDFDSVVVPINSYGGAVFDGIAIHNLLKYETNAKVQARIIGYAMSAGTIVASAADEVYMPDSGFYMIHNPWTIEAGDENDFKETAKFLSNLKGPMVNAYKAKTGLPKSQISDMMDAETWLTAQKAKELGFVDHISKQPNASMPSLALLEKYQNVPDEVLANYDRKIYPVNMKTTFIDKVGSLFNKVFKGEDEAMDFLTELKNEINTAADKFKEHDQLNNDLTSLKDEVVSLKAAENDYKDSISKEVESVKSQISETSDEIASVLDKVNALSEEIVNLKNEKDNKISELKKQLADAKAQDKGSDLKMDMDKRVIDEATRLLIQKEF